MISSPESPDLTKYRSAPVALSAISGFCGCSRKTRRITGSIVFSGWLALSGAGHSASIAIANPGFEDVSGETTVNEFTFGALNGWNLYDPGNITNGGAGGTYFIGTLQPTIVPSADPGNFQFFPAGAPEGSRVGIAFNFSGSGGQGEYGFIQTLTATLQANTTYTLNALVGNIASGTDVALNNYNLNGFPGYRIDLMAGTSVLTTTQTVNPASIPEGQFAPVEYQYTTGASDPFLGQNLAIRLVNLNVIDPSAPAADLEVDFDDIRLSAVAVPEPSVMVFCFAGMALWLGRRER